MDKNQRFKVTNFLIERSNRIAREEGRVEPYPPTKEGIDGFYEDLDKVRALHSKPTSQPEVIDEKIKYIKRKAEKFPSSIINTNNNIQNKKRINWRLVIKIVTVDNTQTAVLLLTALILFFMLLYPPFEFHGVRGLVYDLGYSFIFEPPRHNGHVGGINSTLLGLQGLIMITVSSLIYFSFERFKKK